MPVPAVLSSVLVHRKLRLKSPKLWPLLAVIAYFFLFSLTCLPYEWIISGAGLGICSYLLIARIAQFPLRMRLPLVASCAFIAGAYLYVGRQDGDIILRDSDVTFTFLGKTQSLPRKGLRFDVSPSRRGLFTMRDWSNWTSRSGHEMELGFAGNVVYWGPNGLIRGDDLGYRLSRWAQVKPLRWSKVGPDHMLTHMPRFVLKN